MIHLWRIFMQRQRMVDYRDSAIPVMKNRRMVKLESSDDPVMQYVVNSPSFLRTKTRSAREKKVTGQVLDTGRNVKRLLATQLYTSVDGRRLRPQTQAYSKRKN